MLKVSYTVTFQHLGKVEFAGLFADEERFLSFIASPTSFSDKVVSWSIDTVLTVKV